LAEELNSIETAVRMSHRHLMAALGLVLFIGLAAVLSLSGAATARPGSVLWTVLPVVIAITAASMRGVKKVDARALDAVRKDELRQAGQSRAWRNGFFAVLGLQPVLALALDGNANAAALMAAGSVTIGTAAMLASLLWYDR
jgi:hypothetical protein